MMQSLFAQNYSIQLRIVVSLFFLISTFYSAIAFAGIGNTPASDSSYLTYHLDTTLGVSVSLNHYNGVTVRITNNSSEEVLITSINLLPQFNICSDTNPEIGPAQFAKHRYSVKLTPKSEVVALDSTETRIKPHGTDSFFVEVIHTDYGVYTTRMDVSFRTKKGIRGNSESNSVALRRCLSGVELMSELRQRVLTLNPRDIGLTRSNLKSNVWGFLMEQGYEKNSIMLVSLADGATSLYFSSGGGYIGLGEHEPFKSMSKEMVEAASKCMDKSISATSYPLPANNQVFLYFLTLDGVLKYTSTGKEIMGEKGCVKDMYMRTQLIIREIRLKEEREN